MRFRYGKRNSGRRDFFSQQKESVGETRFLLFCTWETTKIRYHLATIVIFGKKTQQFFVFSFASKRLLIGHILLCCVRSPGRYSLQTRVLLFSAFLCHRRNVSIVVTQTRGASTRDSLGSQIGLVIYPYTVQQERGKEMPPHAGRCNTPD